MVGSDEPVTLTGSFFESFAVENPDLSAMIVNELSMLQLARGLCHAGTPNSEHLSEVLLSECNLIAQDSVMGHEQPSCTPLLDRMSAVAGGRLPDLIQKGFRISEDHLAPGAARPDFPEERVRVHAQGLAGDLDKHFHWGAAGSEVRGETNDPFVSDRRNFNRAAFRHPSHHRGDAAPWKVDGGDRFVGLVKRLPTPKRRRLELCQRPAVLGSRKGGQDPIRIPSLDSRLGHVASEFRSLLA